MKYKRLSLKRFPRKLSQMDIAFIEDIALSYAAISLDIDDLRYLVPCDADEADISVLVQWYEMNNVRRQRTFNFSNWDA